MISMHSYIIIILVDWLTVPYKKIRLKFAINIIIEIHCKVNHIDQFVQARVEFLFSHLLSNLKEENVCNIKYYQMYDAF